MVLVSTNDRFPAVEPWPLVSMAGIATELHLNPAIAFQDFGFSFLQHQGVDELEHQQRDGDVAETEEHQ